MLYGTLSPGRRLDGAHGVEIEFRLDEEFDDVPIGRSLVIQYSGWPAYDGVHNVRYGLDLMVVPRSSFFASPALPTAVSSQRSDLAATQSPNVILALVERFLLLSKFHLRYPLGAAFISSVVVVVVMLVVVAAHQSPCRGQHFRIHRGNVVSIR